MIYTYNKLKPQTVLIFLIQYFLFKMSYYDKIIHVNTRELEKIDAKDTTMLDKPQIYGCFSLDKDRNYIPGTKNMVYYFPRFNEIDEGSLELNLNLGMDRVVRKPEGLDEKLDNLLKFILENKHKFLNRDENKLIDTDFVCYRGLLTKIMCSIHLKDEWTICATKWKGSIYLCEINKKVTYNIPESEMNKFSSWGYKFEQYMVTDKFGELPDTSKPVYEPEEFCCIYKSKLGAHKLIYGAEMDGVMSSKEIDVSDPDWDNLEFIELKTSKQVIRPNDERTMKMYKYIKWWSQCFLVNIKQVHCGFRDRNGIVRDIAPYNVKDLPKISDNLWDWKTCLNFCNIFLNIVKDIIPDDANNPYTVWKFDWKPEYHQIKYQELKGQSPYRFLPQWYLDNMNNK